MLVSELRTMVRDKADEPSTGYISDAEVLRYLNQGLRFIHGKIVQRFENYFIVPGTTGNGGKFDTVSGTQEYSLPTTLQKIVRVEHRVSTSTSDNDWRKLETLNIANDRLDDYYPVREGYTPSFGYFIAGNKIYLRPVPAQAYTIRLWFIPRVTALSADSDTPEIPTEYHELLAEYAAIQCLAKSGEGIWKERQDVFTLELANLLENIEIRDQQPEQMVITQPEDFDRYGI